MRNYSLDPAHREERRRRVERLKLRGLSNREVVKALAKAGLKNPSTGEPYGKDTIDKDARVLRRKWAEEHKSELNRARAAQLATIKEALRVAWARGDLAEVRLFLKREAELLGLDAPKEQRFAGDKGGPIQYRDVTEPTDAQKIRRLEMELRQLDEDINGLEEIAE